MKTDLSKFTVLVESTQVGLSESQARKPLQTLQSNASSNGNFAGKKITSKDNLKITKLNEEKIKKGMINEHTQTIDAPPPATVDKGIQLALNEITASDLTTDGNPSEKYWEVLAEKRRLALEQVLVENKNLLKRVELLEEKCCVKDAMLSEARLMAEVLQELLNEN